MKKGPRVTYCTRRSIGGGVASVEVGDSITSARFERMTIGGHFLTAGVKTIFRNAEV